MGDSSIKSLLRIDDNAGPQKIGFLLLNQFSMIAFASAVEPLRAANRQANEVLFEWVVVSAEGQGSTASNGMLIQTNTCIEALQECCIVFVCAGVRVRENTNKAILNLIRRLDRNGSVIGAICTGTYVMAAAGLLEDGAALSIGNTLMDCPRNFLTLMLLMIYLKLMETALLAQAVPPRLT